MKGLFFLLWCLLLVRDTRAQPGTYIRYSATEGLNGNYVYDLAQDREGFIWISSNTGVYRFDGTHFRQFRTTDGLPDNEVLDIHVDKDNRVWFCCFNGRIGYYHKGRFAHPGNTPTLARIRLTNHSSRFYEGRNNTNHILGVGEEYVQLKTSKDSILSFKLMPYPAIAYWEDDTNSYYLSKRWIYKNGKPFYPIKGHFPAPPDVRQQALYYMHPGKLFCFRNGREQLLFTWKGAAKPQRLDVLDPGRIFLTSNDGKVTELTERAGTLTISRVFADIYSPGRTWVDKDGATWITSLADGLYYYPRNKRNARAALFSPQWPGKIITDMEVCGTQVIAGFENGSVACFSKELTLDTILLRSSNIMMMVKSIHYDSILKKMTVAGGKVFVWEANGKSKFRVLPVIDPRFPLTGIFKDAELTASGKLYLNSIRQLHMVDVTAAGLTIDSLFGSLSRKYAICKDRASARIWYSDIDGLHYLDQGKSRSLNCSSAFLRQRITDIKSPAPNFLVLTTEDEGVGIIDTLGNIRQMITPQALHWGSVSKTKIYGDQLWLAGETGIGMFRFNGGSYSPVFWANKNNGLLSDNVLSFCVDRDFLYVVTAQGVQKLDIRSLTQKPDKPRLMIHSVQNKTHVWLNPSGRISLPGKSKEIRLECSALSFGNTAPVTFAYRFEGSDNFIETPGPFFSIPLVFEGEKKLYLRCLKGDSEWSELKVLLLQIPVPLLQRWPVILVLSLSLLITGLLISNYLARRLRKRQLREKDMKQQVTALKLRALQAMMNPHFVFNALNSIQNYINEHDRYRANKYLSKFSKLIRGSLNSSRETKSILAKELAYISNYLDLEQLRFGERLRYTIDLEPGLDADILLIPAMLLQPLAENAVIHGVMASKQPVLIRISCSIDNGSLLICIRDNGPGLNNAGAAQTHKSLGLDMIRDKLQLLGEMQGKNYRFRLENNPGGPGAAAVLQLPLDYLP